MLVCGGVNASILMEADTTSIEAMVMQNQLRCAGHCIRMSDNRLPRQVLFTQLTHGMRTRQRQRFKDTAKRYTKKGQIYIKACMGTYGCGPYTLAP